MPKHYIRRKKANIRRNVKLQTKSNKKGYKKGFKKGYRKGIHVGVWIAHNLKPKTKSIEVQTEPVRDMAMLHARRSRHKKYIAERLHRKDLQTLNRANKKHNTGLDLVQIASNMGIEYYSRKTKEELMREIRAKGSYPGFY